MFISSFDSRKKICPIRNSGNCVGHDCMMWRYATKDQVIRGAAETVAYENGDTALEHVEFFEKEFNSGDFAACLHGYCGLAGTPIVKG
jgi:hypothetical protein